MKKTKVAAGKSIVRDSGGRFVEGNKEGRKEISERLFRQARFF
jgi:hypothetical protein